MHDILVYCESFRRWNEAPHYAARFAAAWDARLTGLYVCPKITIPPWETPGLNLELQEATRQLKEDAFRAGRAFELFAQHRGATAVRWQVAEDDILRALALVGNWHDVVIVGRSQRSSWGTASAVGSMVLGSNMPCIAVPDNEIDVAMPDIVAIAWNGSSEAVRAVHAALPVLSRARKVVILHGKQQPPISMTTWRPGFDLPDYLATHGIRSESNLLSETEEDVGQMLLSAARDVGADMLVMGAYGHTRFSEWVLGGATRRVLELMELPVFMRH